MCQKPQYYGRDASEKLFRGDKSYLGDKSMRVYSDESMSAKIFVEFIALIVRNRIYTSLKEEVDRIDGNPNFMTVPAALKELDKIEMVRGFDGLYRMDHAVTKTQKTILKAFGVDDGSDTFLSVQCHLSGVLMERWKLVI